MLCFACFAQVPLAHPLSWPPRCAFQCRAVRIRQIHPLGTCSLRAPTGAVTCFCDQHVSCHICLQRNQLNWGMCAGVGWALLSQCWHEVPRRPREAVCSSHCGSRRLWQARGGAAIQICRYCPVEAGSAIHQDTRCAATTYVPAGGLPLRLHGLPVASELLILQASQIPPSLLAPF